MSSQRVIIFLACHTPLQGQKSTGGMLQQAGFPMVWLVPCRCQNCFWWCREVLFPAGTDGQLQLCLCLLWHHMALSWMSHPAGASADILAHVLLFAVMLIPQCRHVLLCLCPQVLSPLGCSPA